MAFANGLAAFTTTVIASKARGSSTKLTPLASQALSSLALMGLEAAAMLMRPAQNSRRPALVPVAVALSFSRCPELERNWRMASRLKGYTVLEPTMLISSDLLGASARAGTVITAAPSQPAASSAPTCSTPAPMNTHEIVALNLRQALGPFVKGELTADCDCSAIIDGS